MTKSVNIPSERMSLFSVNYNIEYHFSRLCCGNPYYIDVCSVKCCEICYQYKHGVQSQQMKSNEQVDPVFHGLPLGFITSSLSQHPTHSCLQWASKLSSLGFTRKL